ncbi:MAG TPA: sulfatase-like hydrolase/transferase [Acidobacteriaceae bacterium]
MVTRRDFLRTAGAAVCAAGLPLSADGFQTMRPNLLVILTDEQSADAASYRIGRRYLNTPNIDSLAANGTSFTRAYCANPLCVPSRTSMFTGRYPTETGVMDNTGLSEVHLDPRRFPIMGKIFEDGGYETAYFGKWHIACPEDQANIHGFTRMATTFNDDIAAELDAAEFLREKHDAPFLMVASFLNPHNICEWARGQRLPLGAVGRPPALEQCPPLRANHAPQQNEPDIVALMRRSYQANPMFPVGDFNERQWRDYLWAYYRMIEKVDAQIGIVLDALRGSGHEENTLIVFLSDHGDCQGAHGWNQKTVFYEEASRVPLILSRKGATANTSARLVNTGIDLLPTLCDYAGIAAPGTLPGLSLKNPAIDPRRYVVVSNRMVQGAPIGGRVPHPDGRMVRGQRYKYCVYSEGNRRESLVDLQTDPGEMLNLAGDTHFSDVLHMHRAMLTEWCGVTRDSFAVPAS